MEDMPLIVIFLIMYSVTVRHFLLYLNCLVPSKTTQWKKHRLTEDTGGNFTYSVTEKRFRHRQHEARGKRKRRIRRRRKENKQSFVRKRLHITE
jgi:hypothetical protein